MSGLLAAILGGWEIVMILAILFVLWLWFAALRVERQPGDDQSATPLETMVKLFIAQGFGVGRIPFAPGTFGTLVGVLWFALLVSTGNFWAYLAGAIEGIALSIWLCDEAEKILRQQDPGCVVLDEIIAIPFCFLPWVTSAWLQNNRVLPPVEHFFSAGHWKWALLTVVLFRVFDIAKPWPIRQLQRLPGGWGVTVDDVLAAVYVAVLSLLFIP